MKRILLVIISISIFVQLFAQGKIHVMVWADTQGKFGIANSCKQTINYFEYDLLPDLRQYSGMTVEFYPVIGSEFTKGDILNTINRLSTSNYDVILFYYDGHGGNKGKDNYPTFAFNGYSSGPRAGLGEVYYSLKAKPHRLLLCLANACNKEENNRYESINNGTNSYRTHKSPKAERYKELFREYEGTLLMASSRKGQKSYGNTGEISFFGQAFSRALHEEVNKTTKANWNNIINATYAYTKKAANDNGKLQEPIYNSTLKQLTVVKRTPISTSKSGVASKFGTFTDRRDGKTYKTVKIGTQTWMAENVAYDTNSGCWIHDLEKYGYLYNWETAMQVCPTGWHLPSDFEWQTLIDYLGGAELAGEKLKSSTGWKLHRGKNYGNNESGFSALPGSSVSYDGWFSLEGDGGWWSSTEDGIGANSRCIDYYNRRVKHMQYSKLTGFSVRCIKD